MSHRIDIELTSQTDGGWTWRAAGAKQPKGVLDPSVLYAGAKVGDVVRAEAERELDGVRIVSVIPPRGRKQEGVERIELIERPVGPAFSVTYAEKGRGGRDGRDGGRGDGPRGPRRDGDRPRRDGERADRGPRPDRGERPARPERTDRPARAARPDRPDRPDRGPRPDRAARPERPTRDRPARLAPKKVHRDALIDALEPEQRPVAEQLFRGGIPAVRQAIIDQNAQLRAAGQPEVPAAPLLAMAEDLLPRTRQADWLDHAAAALEAGSAISLRDLRAVVTQADGIAKDDASREMSVKLREALNARIEGERTAWANDITASLDEGKVVRAVRLSGRLPDAGAKLAPELLARLIHDTNAALSADARQDHWAALIEAAADAPFRRDVVPSGLPANAGESLLATAAQASNRIPSLLKLLGLTIPPPPRAKAALARPLPPPPPPMPPTPAATPAAPVPAAEAAEPAPVEPTAGESAAVEPTAVAVETTDAAPAEPAVVDAPDTLHEP